MTATQAESPSLADKISSIFADLTLEISKMRQQADRQQRERYEILQNIFPVSIPAQSGVVPASGTLTISSAELLGPRTGIAWDVRRISIFGLASTTETVSVYKVMNTDSSAAAPQNYVTTLTGPNAYFGPGLGAFLLRAGESLMIQGKSLTQNETVTVSGDAISVGERWLGAYLL